MRVSINTEYRTHLVTDDLTGQDCATLMRILDTCRFYSVDYNDKYTLDALKPLTIHCIPSTSIAMPIEDPESIQAYMSELQEAKKAAHEYARKIAKLENELRALKEAPNVESAE